MIDKLDNMVAREIISDRQQYPKYGNRYHSTHATYIATIC